MKHKIVCSLFSIAIFTSGLFLGAYISTSAGASSNSTELYNSIIHLSSVHQQIENGELENAKQAICSFVRTRIELLELGHQILNENRAKEVMVLKQSMEKMLSNTSQASTSLAETCV